MADKKTQEKLRVAEALEREEKVEELTAALLREYMHRKGYKSTLAKFDEENPRTTSTISSRLVMNELMALQTISERNKALHSPPFGTIMELLCSYRLRKREQSKNERVDPKTAATSDGSQDPTFTQVDNHAEYDSSDTETFYKAKVAQREAAVAAARAKAEQAAKEKKEKKEKKKDKKEKADKKEKKDKKKGERSSLDAGMLTMAALDAGKDKDEGLKTRGSKWMPGSMSGVPSVGLGGSSGTLSTPVEPPSFLAGDGMSLMANQRKADPVAEWEAPVSNSPPRSNGGLGEGFSVGKSGYAHVDGGVGGVVLEDGIGMSPDHFRKLYNPSVEAKGVLAQSSSNVTKSASMRKEGRKASFSNSPGSSMTDIPSANSSASSPPKERSRRRVKIMVDD